jgi:hypothetical protein
MHGDVEVVPTPSTGELFERLGLRTRAHPDGLTVFAEVEPDSAPPVLRRSLGAVSWRFAFELRARNTALLTITDLPAFRPAQTIFCFDNLRKDVDAVSAGGRTHLGDRVADARIGPPVTLVTSDVYTYTLGAPAVAATITIRDRFGAAVATLDARSPDPAAPLSDYRLDFTAVPKVVPGRYQITDDQGGASKIYYDAGLAASRPIGVIEIYARTDGLTPDATDRVPASYRFITADTLTDLDPYYIQLEAVATTWRYRVTKKYANSLIALPTLSISGPVVFGPVSVSGDSAVLTSTAAVSLSAVPRGLKLLTPAKEVRDLPEPDLTTPLGAAAPLLNFVSDMFVYV